MEKAIQAFAAINFSLMGISHIIHHRAWAGFFILLHRQGKAGAFCHGFLSLFTGTLIVAFHRRWTGLSSVLTVTGWLFVLKSIVVFLAPEVEVRSLGRVRLEGSKVFVGAGVFLAALGGLFAYCFWME